MSEWLPQASEAGDKGEHARRATQPQPTALEKGDELAPKQEFKNGEVSEWLKEHAWKVCIRQRIEGSNPSLTAILKEELQQCGSFCLCNLLQVRGATSV